MGPRGDIGVGARDVSSSAGSRYLRPCGREGLGEAPLVSCECGTGVADRDGDKFYFPP